MGDPNEREPCPHRIIDDVGTAFSMGAIGGTFWHAFKGARSSPKGERLYGSVTGACSVCVFVAPLSLVTPPPRPSSAIKSNARRVGGGFAVWGGLFSAYDCTFIHLREKEDPWNAIASGFCTGATLAARSGTMCPRNCAGALSHTRAAGPRAAFASGCFGGIFLAVIEGIQIGLQKFMSPNSPMMQVRALGQQTGFALLSPILLRRNKQKSSARCRRQLLRVHRHLSPHGLRKCLWEISRRSRSRVGVRPPLPQTSMMIRCERTA